MGDGARCWGFEDLLPVAVAGVLFGGGARAAARSGRGWINLATAKGMASVAGSVASSVRGAGLSCSAPPMLSDDWRTTAFVALFAVGVFSACAAYAIGELLDVDMKLARAVDSVQTRVVALERASSKSPAPPPRALPPVEEEGEGEEA